LGQVWLAFLHKGNGMANNCLTRVSKVRCNPTNTSNGVYGALWLTLEENSPKDLFSKWVPSQKCLLYLKDMVIVRLGLTDESL
jgi:hypothetical protein